MSPTSADQSSAALNRQREEIRRRLERLGVAALAIALVVTGLALLAVLLAYQAALSAERAREASRQANQQRVQALNSLWQASLSEARFGRLSGLAGRREQCLQAVAKAAQIRPTLELRNEAIAALVLADVREVSRLAFPQTCHGRAFDAGVERIA